jgi:DNA-binding CsgD family transcriptional regulator
MDTLTAKSYFEIFKAQSDRLLPDKQFKLMVSEEEQKNELSKLEQTLHYEKFFFVFNNVKFSIEQVKGIKTLLGYNDNEFSVMQYYRAIHPSHLAAQLLIAYELLESLISGQWPIGFLSHRVVNTIALHHANGEYYLYKRVAWPFQYDEHNRLISYLNEFTLIGKYSNEPYTIRFMDNNDNLIDWKARMPQSEDARFTEHGVFSKQEMRILLLFAEYPSLLSKEIAHKFNIKESTVITYKKRILDKAERLFHYRFKSAKHVAEYLKEQGLVFRQS